MSQIDTSSSIASLVAEKPARARVFQNLRLDFCCGGKASLAESCASLGLDPRKVVAQLESCDAGEEQSGFERAQSLPATELSRYIEQHYHDWLREELPRLYQLACKAESRHSAHYPWLVELREVFGDTSRSMMSHMKHEEATVFPAIRELARLREVSGAERLLLETELKQLEAEHSSCGDEISRMRRLSSDYSVPENSCNTLRALIHGLQQFESLMHEHVYLENYVLFSQLREMLARA